MSGSSEYSKEGLLRLRSLLIATELQKRRDLKAAEMIRGFSEDLDWDLDSLAIDAEAWQYVNDQDYDPKLVFCHPEFCWRRRLPASTTEVWQAFPLKPPRVSR